MSIKPYLTSNSIVDSVKLRMMFPLSQQTFTYSDILKIVNEEMMINAVPQVKMAHEEYYVFKVLVPLVNGIARYEIPYRALGMALRDLFYSDNNGNYIKMNRVAPEDKAYFQSSFGNSQVVDSYYVEGNNIVLSTQIISGASGFLNFFIYLRPNYLVRDERACIIQNYLKYITVANNSAIVAGDTISISLGNQTQSPSTIILKAVTGTPGASQFQIGATAALTATNINNALNALASPNITATVSASDCVVNYKELSISFSTTNKTAFTIDTLNTLIQFDQLPSTYIDPETNVTSPLYVQNGLVDFLQTNPGHATYNYDVPLRAILSGNVGKFKNSDLQTYLNNSSGGDMGFLPIKIGDYICPQNECIIPQIPPELHYALAERAASFVLQAIGDSEGYNRSEARIQKMNEAQNSLITNRVEGATVKVFNPYNLVRSGKRGRGGRW